MAGEGRPLPSFFIDSLLQRDAEKEPLPEDDDAQARPGGGADDALPETADVTPEVVNFGLADAHVGDAASVPSVVVYRGMGYQGDAGTLEGGTLGGTLSGTLDACYQDALCPDLRSAGTLGCYGDGRPVDGLRCQGDDRREEGALEDAGGIHIHDEPKPEVSDLSGAVDDGKKRPRTAFSADQVRSLEQEFQRSKYLSVSKRTEMSRQLGLTEQQIKIWFQNRRTKWKRKYTNNLEILAQQHYLRMGLLPAYPLPHPPGGPAPKPPNHFVFGPAAGGLGGVRGPFTTPQSAVRLYPPFTAGPALPRM